MAVQPIDYTKGVYSRYAPRGGPQAQERQRQLAELRLARDTGNTPRTNPATWQQGRVPYNRVGNPGYAASQAEIQTNTTDALTALRNKQGDFEKDYAAREKLLGQQYAQTRAAMGAEKTALSEEMKRGIERQIASQGGAGGGSAIKSLQKGNIGLGQQFGSLEAGLGAEQAAATQALRGEKAQERLAREEAIRQADQFAKTLKFQEGSFAEQMAYTWAELDENQKTNLVNATALFRDLELNEDWMARLRGPMASIYGQSRTAGYPVRLML